MPRFSVVLPTFNRSGALRHTIDSVLAQTERDWQLVVVSDASTDDTDAVVHAYADPRIQLVRLPARAGHPGPPRNAGLAVAQGALIAYLDHDDRWVPEHLAVLGALLDRGGGARLAATGAVPIDDDGRLAGRPTSALDSVWSHELQTMSAIFEPSRVGHRRGIVEAAGGWGSAAAGLEDWDLWLRLADRGERFATTARPTALLTQDAHTRRHRLPVRHELVLGRAPSLPHALHALHLFTLPPLRARLRELQVGCSARWYAALEAEGRLALPDGATPASWRSLWDAALPEDPMTPYVGARPTDGGAVITRPLACTTAEHAARIERIARRRLADLHAFIARIVDAAARLPAEALER